VLVILLLNAGGCGYAVRPAVRFTSLWTGLSAVFLPGLFSPASCGPARFFSSFPLLLLIGSCCRRCLADPGRGSVAALFLAWDKPPAWHGAIARSSIPADGWRNRTLRGGLKAFFFPVPPYKPGCSFRRAVVSIVAASACPPDRDRLGLLPLRSLSFCCPLPRSSYVFSLLLASPFLLLCLPCSAFLRTQSS